MQPQIDAQGKAHKGRVIKFPAHKLDLPGHDIQSTISVWLYFIPDVDLEIHLEEAVAVQTCSSHGLPLVPTKWNNSPNPHREQGGSTPHRTTLYRLNSAQLNSTSLFCIPQVSGTRLSEDYLARAKTFWQTMSRPVRDTIEAAMKVELGKAEDYDLDQEQINQFMSAEDQVATPNPNLN